MGANQACFPAGNNREMGGLQPASAGDKVEFGCSCAKMLNVEYRMLNFEWEFGNLRHSKFSIQHSIFASYCIHEGLLNMGEQEDADEEDQGGEAGTERQVLGTEGAGAQKAVTEGLDDRGHGIEQDEPEETAALELGQGINDRGGVHGELDGKADQEAQVTVLGGQGGDDDAAAQAEPGHDQDQERGQEQDGIGTDGVASEVVIAEKTEEQDELDAVLEQAGNDDGQWHGKPREIDFAKDAGVLDEGVGGAVQAVGEIVPADDTGKVEEDGGQAVSAELGDVAEDDGEDEGGEQGLDDEPQGAENGLLEVGDEVAPDEHADEVAIAPEVVQVQVEPAGLGTDDEVPGVGGGGRGSGHGKVWAVGRLRG